MRWWCDYNCSIFIDWSIIFVSFSFHFRAIICRTAGHMRLRWNSPTAPGDGEQLQRRSLPCGHAARLPAARTGGRHQIAGSPENVCVRAGSGHFLGQPQDQQQFRWFTVSVKIRVLHGWYWLTSYERMFIRCVPGLRTGFLYSLQDQWIVYWIDRGQWDRIFNI